MDLIWTSDLPSDSVDQNGPALVLIIFEVVPDLNILEHYVSQTQSPPAAVFHEQTHDPVQFLRPVHVHAGH